ncbi:hypothetical protein LTR85_002223 [Meristemomyces frigidus]|nr:hypothetical protein LTR85_002223 [Meristemomyces frigidus]
MAKRRKPAKRSLQSAGDDDSVNHSSRGDVDGGHDEDDTTLNPGDDEENHVEKPDVGHFEFDANNKAIVCERRGMVGKPSLIWTHGAGGGLEAPATKDFADGFAARASIVSFKGAMNLVSRTKVFHAVIEHEGFDAALGGRSMGARAACIAATQEERQTKALVLVSFPLIGGTKGDSREQILLDLPEEIDVLLISGTKDSMCDLEQLAAVTAKMNARCWMVVVQAANHGMDWKWKDSAQQMRRMTGALAAEWLESRDRSKRHCVIRWDEEAGQIQCEGWKEGEKEVQKLGDEEAPPAKRRKKTK